jgi:hypothetical protein
MTRKVNFNHKKSQHRSEHNLSIICRKITKSTWLFPAVLLLIVIVLSLAKINGSSIGVYSSYFYGDKPDENLILNEPRPIRSDEWIVNTQQTIGQSNNNYSRVNDNVGDGQDMSVLSDAPYKEWTTLFKPLNLAFFVLPFEIAFALKWWLMGYLLIISCYFFILHLLPNKIIISILLSVGFFFSPFVQWWYLYGTLAVLYYAFLGALFFMKILSAKSNPSVIGWSLGLYYVVTSFALILYPPFQIPALLAVVFFCIGYALERRGIVGTKKLFKRLSVLIPIALFSLITIFCFYYTRNEIFSIIQSTAYPGVRVVKSGGFSILHFFASPFSYQHQFLNYSSGYKLPGGIENQSATSNFILLLPFLILPAIYVVVKIKKIKNYTDWPLVFSVAGAIFLAAWMFVGGLDFIGTPLLLNKVPHLRMIIAFGLLNYFVIILLFRISVVHHIRINRYFIWTYFAVCTFISLFIAHKLTGQLPEFISYKRAYLLAMVFPVITFMILKNKILLASLLIMSFSIFSSYLVNPLYKGTSILTETNLSQTIQEISYSDADKKWVSDESILENFATMNGLPSISGVYLYPQLDLWEPVMSDEDIYNRYAHTNFVFDRDINKDTGIKLQLVGEDNFGIFSEPCNDFLKTNNVGFILTRVEFKEEVCLDLIKTINYPEKIFYIYRTTFN